MTLINDTIRSLADYTQRAVSHVDVSHFHHNYDTHNYILLYIFQRATHAAYANTKHYVMCRTAPQRMQIHLCAIRFTVPYREIAAHLILILLRAR